MKRLSSATVFEGQIVRVDIDTVQLTDGTCLEMEIVRHPGGGAVVALDAQDRVALLRQYRYVLDEWLWELPAGKTDAGESVFETARRELAEEAGVNAGCWRSLGRYVSSPGIFAEQVQLFLATDLTESAARPEAGELFELHWIALDEAIRLADAGKIVDGKSAVGLWRARSVLDGRTDALPLEGTT